MAQVQKNYRSEETGQHRPVSAPKGAPAGTAQQGRFNALILILILGFIVNLISGAIFNNTSFEAASGSISTALYGTVLLLSLLKKPLFYYLALSMRGGTDPARRKYMKQMWQQSARYRSFLYTLTAGWGVGLLLGSALYIYCAYQETAAQFQVVSFLVRWGTIAVLLLGTVLYIRLRRRIGNARHARG
jgi:hypothetical protein